ncbi:hypothetical protein WKW79_21840 [Variovorax robiniae]|uniref:PilC beta-propeller domain-containing protein n=1 Tax=Variovorax robiniae TaxID=1836199 RepID=A0ABU8XBZ7_9BURK
MGFLTPTASVSTAANNGKPAHSATVDTPAPGNGSSPANIQTSIESGAEGTGGGTIGMGGGMGGTSVDSSANTGTVAGTDTGGSSTGSGSVNTGTATGNDDGDAGTATIAGPGTSPSPGTVSAPVAISSTLCGTTIPDVVDASLKVVPDAYRAMAGQLSKDAGIAYRYGPTAAACGASGGVPLYGPRPNNKTPGFAQMAADHQNLWQIGKQAADPGLYSSNQANAAFVADSAARVGITDFQTTNHVLGTFAQLPQLSWTHYGGGLDSISILAYKAAGIVDGSPIAVTRCGGRAGFCPSGLAVFQNGVIATVGNNTATNKATVKLPAQKVPTGIAMTNGSEFALVTVWDTDALKGQVAVVALAGLCDNCNPFNRNANGSYSAWYNWWREWSGVYPGLPNAGNIAFMKILGYVDLVAPDGSAMNAPTEITVTTGLDPFHTMAQARITSDLTDNMAKDDDLAGIGFMGFTQPLTRQANRQSFLDGSLSAKYAKGGMAVVLSKSEKKIAFLDLKPLFSYVNSVYFGGDIGTFNARMATLGQADHQWPYTFANQPQQTPALVKMVSLPDKPTAVKTTLWDTPQRAWIATEDGTLRVYNLGGYASGGAVASPSPDQIAELPQFAINVGRNPTSLGISRGDPEDPDIYSPQQQYADPNKQVLVNSRGDRRISWVRFDANGSRIVRTLQDPRVLDPIAIEDADNFANWAFVVTVADHAGKAVHNFRYGPVLFIDNVSCPRPTGCPVEPTNGVKIEYGGKMDLPGKPFQLSGTNVP